MFEDMADVRTALVEEVGPPAGVVLDRLVQEFEPSAMSMITISMLLRNGGTYRTALRACLWLQREGFLTAQALLAHGDDILELTYEEGLLAWRNAEHYVEDLGAVVLVHPSDLSLTFAATDNLRKLVVSGS